METKGTYKMKHTAFILLLLLLCGCGVFIPATHSIDKMSQLSISEKRRDVISAIGRPDVVRASRMKDDKRIQIDEYRLWQQSVPMKNFLGGFITFTLMWWWPIESRMPYAPNRETYWLYYEDDVLAQWGQPGDFQKSQNYRMLFGNAVEP